MRSLLFYIAERHLRENGGGYLKENGNKKKVGWIGAGKVGCSLGKHMKDHGITLSGYYSRNRQSAQEAAAFTDSHAYEEMEELVKDSDILFLTVPDGQIAGVWDRIKALQQDLRGKTICHASGSLSSEVFSGIDSQQAVGFSVHPLYAIHDKYHSYKDLDRCLFTIEGKNGPERELLAQLLSRCGNEYEFMSAESKALYHAAAVVVSNFVVGLSYLGEKMLTDCGFSKENSVRALIPMLLGNAENIKETGSVNALTGPVERNDVSTILRHLQAFAGQQEKSDTAVDYALVTDLYKDMTKLLVDIGQEKHKDYDYGQLKEILEK